MCTVVILRRPAHPWPVLLAANRDEMRSRATLPPGRHWPDRPEVTAGLDGAAGGSWLGLNDHGLVAAVMDRHGTLGREPRKRSRGELVLEALDHAEADAAAEALAELYPAAYRPFNLVVADPRRAYWIRHDGGDTIQVTAIPPGLHMLAGSELDDPGHPRVATYLPRFQTAGIPDPERDDWSDWIALMGERHYPEALGPVAAMVQDQPNGFQTRSGALIALPSYPGFDHRPRWLHAEGAPTREAFGPVM